MITRINIWSSPRNISTALMYSFAQRPDTCVVDEPLYAHYLSKAKTEARHPGADEVLASQCQDGTVVIRKVIFGDYPRPVVLFKQMTHHLVGLDWSFMLKTRNIILIRNPREIIQSYTKVVPNPTIHDIGVEKQTALFDYLSTNQTLSAVIDATELLKNPQQVLSLLCASLGLPFCEDMLNWPKGPRPEDGVWAKYWYHAVHHSTGFTPYSPRNFTLPLHLEKLAEECMPHYNRLYEYALKA